VELAFKTLNGKKIKDRWVKLDRADALSELEIGFTKGL
jgi:hypothetical protein